MNLFIIGSTKSGKTTLAKTIAESNHIEASYDLKEKFPIKSYEDKSDYVCRITQEAINILKEDPDYFYNHIKSKIVNDKLNVISGVRNINDFIKLFNIETDKVLLLNCSPFTLFEEYGLNAIVDYIKFNEYINHKQIIFNEHSYQTNQMYYTR